MAKRVDYVSLALALLSSLILFAGWPPRSLAPLLFIGLVPLFILEKRLSGKGKTGTFFLYLYLSLFLFNLGTTWWVWYASKGGSVAMLLANTLLMTVPFMFYRFTRQVLGMQKALMAFVLYWLSFEYIHFRWDLSYPWLTLGNGFSSTPGLVQWYEYTGVLGGTLWILLSNVFIFKWSQGHGRVSLISAIAMLLAPLLWSSYLNSIDYPSTGEHEIVVVQPNIDPYKEKFTTGNELKQVLSFFKLADEKITPTTKLVILPETAIVEYLDEDHINSFRSVKMMANFVKKNPQLQILTGASTYAFYRDGKKPSVTARLHEGSGLYYDSYNTALLIDSNGVQQLYHKSKLVPGTEKMPYPGLLKFIGPLAINMGGISGSLGSDSTSKTFVRENLAIRPAPLICYESVFGSYVSSFVRKGANVLFVMTNDGWWDETDGHRQHMHYARLRAIENRRYVVRSANTGISCVIDAKGKVSNQTSWWVDVSFNTNIPTMDGITFYAKHGDFIGRISAFLGLFLLLSVWVKRRIKA